MRFRLLVVVGVLVLMGAAPVAGQPAPAGAAEAFSEAYALYTGRFYEQAADAFLAFRAAYPDHPTAAEALYYEAESALALDYVEEAVALFRRFQRQYPDHPLAFEARLGVGQYFLRTGDYDRAIATLEEALADGLPPETAARALYWMGAAAQERGRSDEALTYFRRAADDYVFTETAPAALYGVAYLHVQREEYDEAVRAFELLTARYPDSPYSRNIGLALAEVYYELNDYRRVVEEVEKRLPMLEPEARERATFLQAEAYNQLRDTENAIVHYQRFIQGNPQSPYYRRALYGLGWSYYFVENYEWAADRFAEAREGYDDELAMQATYYEGVSRKLNGKPGVAADLFEEVADRWPSSELADRALYERGVALYELRQWERARDTFNRLASTYVYSDLLGDAFRLRGYTNVALNDFDEAFRDFDQAIELEAAPPELKSEVRFQKAWLLYRAERFAEAAPAFLELYQEQTGTSKADEALFWAAESLYQLGELEESISRFRQYLHEFAAGRFVDAAHYALGWAFFRQGRYDRALSEFTEFLQGYRGGDDFVPYRTDAQLRLADSYYALKRYNEAIQAYQRVGEAGGDYALYQIGQAFSNAGDTFEAITTFRRLLDEFPESGWREEAHYTLGYLYFQNQDFDQAIAAYRSLIETYPRDPLAAKAQYGIGDALFNAGRLEEAVAAYTAVLELYPNSPFAGDAAASLQYALLEMNDEARAEAFIVNFERNNPGSPLAAELRFRQSEVRYQSGRIDQSLVGFQQFIERNPSHPRAADARYYIGQIQASRGDTDAAVAAFEQARQSEGAEHRADAAERLAGLYLAQQRYDEALAAYRQVEQLRSSDPALVAQARYGQGMALLQLGRTDEAETLLREYVEQQGEVNAPLPALLGLARVYEANRRPADAMRIYRSVSDRSTDENGAEALYRLGALLLDRGETEVAIAQLSRLPTLYPGHAEWIAQSYLLQARAFSRLGQNGEAVRLYDRVIEEFANTTYAQTASREKANL